MRCVVVTSLLLLAACAAAPRHRAELDVTGTPRAGTGGGGTVVVLPPLDAGPLDAELPPAPQAAAEAPCDVLGSCCAALSPLDPARDWCTEFLGIGSPETCAAGVDDLVASGECRW